ncbi:MAG: hypothetical protein QM661_01925 [Solimonas sp.]
MNASKISIPNHDGQNTILSALIMSPSIVPATVYDVPESVYEAVSVLAPFCRARPQPPRVP